VAVARQLASIAELAPGRLTFGVGIGGEDRHEIRVCGVDPRTRGRRMDECLQILRALASGGPVTFEGEFFSLNDALVIPTPSPPIPLVVGGRSEAAVRRAGRLGDGWLGIWVSPKRFATVVDQIRRMRLPDAVRALRALLAPRHTTASRRVPAAVPRGRLLQIQRDPLRQRLRVRGLRSRPTATTTERRTLAQLPAVLSGRRSRGCPMALQAADRQHTALVHARASWQPGRRSSKKPKAPCRYYPASANSNEPGR
jgi:alkanesulfonate monooxygenase SsuD/methylene tetrahydromethanopterin reductase-like flavin-dependent oxidoreductase (luciferase family)